MKGLCSGAVVAIPSACVHHFFEKDLRRHSSRGHAFAHLLDGLVETGGEAVSVG